MKRLLLVVLMMTCSVKAAGEVNMKRILFVLLTITCSVSWAEWRMIGTGVDKETEITFYYDTSTIVKNGSIAKIWVLQNYSSTQMNAHDKSFNSTKTQRKFECNEETNSISMIVFYENLFGKGEIVHTSTYSNKEFTPVIPGSIGYAMMKIACGQK